MSVDNKAGSLRTATTIRELAQILGLEDVNGADLLELALNSESNNYATWHISKKGGRGFRRISSPKPRLKMVQRALTSSLADLYEASPHAHGFIVNKSITTNAAPHVGQRWVFNIDIEDFFPTVTAHRIEGMLKKPPYELHPNIAEVITRLCTYQGCLPAGAPSSPLLSNMICRSLDKRLAQIARDFQCVYTRYADDLTFSSSLLEFPREIAIRDSSTWGVGPTLVRQIVKAGFRINDSKVRMQEKSTLQSVTGLVVNEKLNVERRYIRSIRGAIHAWDRYGYHAANEEFNSRIKKRKEEPQTSLSDVLWGRIAYISMVRGEDDPLVLTLREKLKRLQSREMPVSNSSDDTRGTSGLELQTTDTRIDL